jgi:hypothetical protein
MPNNKSLEYRLRVPPFMPGRGWPYRMDGHIGLDLADLAEMSDEIGQYREEHVDSMLETKERRHAALNAHVARVEAELLRMERDDHGEAEQVHGERIRRQRRRCTVSRSNDAA